MRVGSERLMSKGMGHFRPEIGLVFTSLGKPREPAEVEVLGAPDSWTVDQD